MIFVMVFRFNYSGDPNVYISYTIGPLCLKCVQVVPKI